MAVTIVQISDCHLFGNTADEMDGVRTASTFQSVCDAIAASGEPADLLLATGDISHDGTPASYRHFAERVERLGAGAVAWLPGNHDDPSMMATCEGGDGEREAAGRYGWMQRSIAMGGWQLLLLDSRAEGRVDGELSPAELSWLAEQLRGTESDHVAICLHHHPIEVGCWLDRYILVNGDELMACACDCPKVRTMMFGHIHQEFDRVHRGIRLLGVPSTCVQARVGAPERAMDPVPPGYRRLKLMEDGELETEVVRVARELR